MSVIKKMNIIMQEAIRIAAKGNYVTASIIFLGLTIGMIALAIGDIIYRIIILVIAFHQLAFDCLCGGKRNHVKRTTRR